MDSLRGTRVVKLERKKNGLGFSFKGGTEHGIAVVVSDVEKGGAAASKLQLGDEIIKVDGTSLQGVSHVRAVQILKGAGPIVTLTVRSNQALEDVFSSHQLSLKDKSLPKYKHHHSTESVDSCGPVGLPDDASVVEEPNKFSGPLPRGWGQNIDHKTGRFYFENHLTRTSTWTDPRSLTPKLLEDFDWKSLPPGWEMFLDELGDIYYVHHDTQTTHWDHPQGMREQRQLNELREFLEERKGQLEVVQSELKEKRKLLLTKNTSLETAGQCRSGEDIGEENEKQKSPSDIINDIMVLNEEVDDLDVQVQLSRRQLHQLNEILKEAQQEEIEGRDEACRAAQKLAHNLHVCFSSLKRTERDIHQQMASIEELRQREGLGEVPLTYMLQLSPPEGEEEVMEKERWLHTLPDRLTGKTNCEMRLELCVLGNSLKAAERIQQRVSQLLRWAQGHHKTSEEDWAGKVIDELTGMDFSLLRDDWLQSKFREKLERSLYTVVT